ncbi:uncharacterized protein LOC115631627 [Scaptodrosophila lebanonensis]|uniref:Uncharacterized protein LOC115631627 n=1 Tax=Drosophila lebanonensis TaxID=7225 RepID=A0A6J2U7K1_DROLE|nr:uncharacterized protein LOC115631627 [Scaptodrosophila lebanonensis]
MAAIRLPQLLQLLHFLLISWPSCSAIICYHCDSIALEDCAMTLGEVGVLPYVDCTSELTCAMSIVDSITYRGCGGDTPTTGATYKKICSSNLCNAGVYPPGRLKCHHCAGDSCVAEPAGKPHPCRHHHEEDECYTEVLSSQEAYRGCRSDTNHTIAGATEYCDINGCNDLKAASSLRCARCDSQEGRGCKMDLFHINGGKCNISLYDQCEMEVLLAGEGQSCFTYRRLNRVVRGCTTELPADIDLDGSQIVECDSDNCNLGCTAQQRCLTCDSASNELCLSNATAVASSVCGSAESSSCFACEYADWSVRRGCGAPPSDAPRCYQCDEGDGCNAQPLTRCYECSSLDEAGASCANWERPVGIFIEECQMPAAPCLMASYENGTTLRGCQRSDFNCSMNGLLSCRSCEGSFCNKGAFPEKRLWCHQCVGGADCAVISGDPRPCDVPANEPLETTMACLEYYDGDRDQPVRGCRTNSQLYYECLFRSDKSTGCKLCRTNGCNDSPLMLQQTSKKLQEQAMDFLGFVSGRSTANKLATFPHFCYYICLIYHIISI